MSKQIALTVSLALIQSGLMSVNAMANATVKEVAVIINMINLRNTKVKYMTETAKMIRDEFGGEVPSSYDDLLKLKGVGRKIASWVSYD